MSSSLGHDRKWDLSFPAAGVELGLMLWRPDGRRAVSYATAGAQVGEDSPRRAVPYPVDDWSLGGGYSYGVPGLDGIYAYAPNGDGRAGRVFLPGPAVTELSLPSDFTAAASEITGSFEQGSNVYFVGWRYALVMTGGSGTPTISQDLGFGFIAESATLHGQDAYVGGSGGSFWRRTAAGVWSQASSIVRRQLSSVFWVNKRGVGAPTLVASDADNRKITYVTGTPFTAGDWFTPFGVGDDSHAITRLVSAGNHVYVGRTDGVHDLDEYERNANLSPYHRAHLNANNNKAMAYRANKIWCGLNAGLDLVATNGMVQDIAGFRQPGAPFPNETPAYGRPTAMVSDGSAMIVALYNGTDTYICWVYEDARAPGGLVWHIAPIYLANQRVTWLHITSLPGTPRLIIHALQGSTPKCYWAPLVMGGGTALQDYLNTGGYQFASSYSLFQPYQNFGSSSANKILTMYQVGADNLSNASLQMLAAADSRNYLSQGTITRAPYQELVSGTDAISGRQVGFKIVGTGTPTAPPILRSFTPLASVKVRRQQVWTYQVLVGEEIETHSGRDDRDPALTLDKLDQLQDRGPVMLVDHYGRTLTVLVEQVIPGREILDPSTQSPATVFELTVTVLSRQRRGTTWGSGDDWGAGFAYGGEAA